VQANKVEDGQADHVVEIVAGTAIVAVAAAAAAVMYSGAELAGRAAIPAVAVGVVAARVKCWQAAVIAAIVAALIVALFLAEDATAVMRWGFSPLFVVALMLGRGIRPLAHQSTQPDARDREADNPPLVIWPDRRPAAAPPDDTTGKR
jgi:hypothetical protein